MITGLGACGRPGDLAGEGIDDHAGGGHREVVTKGVTVFIFGDHGVVIEHITAGFEQW